MTTNTNPSSTSSLVLAGAAAEGHGALAGWRGAGPLTRVEILAALAEAGLPEEWAPAAKGDVGHAGVVLGRVPHGLILRRATASRWTKTEAGRTRAYRARWVVVRNRAQAADVGEVLGEVVLVAELRDSSDELHVAHADAPEVAALAERIRADYRAARDAAVYDSGDVTDWLRTTLQRQCGAARFSTGLYIPREGREQAERLVAAVLTRWGVDWIAPLLPVATSEQLAVGLVRGLDQDVAAIELDLASERADALTRRQQTEVSATVAARLLKLCTEQGERLEKLAPLCGEHLAPVRERLRALQGALKPLVGKDVQRFGLLELDGPVKASERQPARRAPASVAADRALARRRAEHAEAAAEPSAREQSIAERPLVLDEDLSQPGWVPPGVRAWIAELAADRDGRAA